MTINFLPAGRQMIMPVELTEAVSRAVFAVPSADATLFGNAAGEFVIVHPWKTQDEADWQAARYCLAADALLNGLKTGAISTYVQNPETGAYLRVPRGYWYQVELLVESSNNVEQRPNARGLDASTIGRPIMVTGDDLQAWTDIACAFSDEEVAQKLVALNFLPQPMRTPGASAPTKPPRRQRKTVTSEQQFMAGFFQVADRSNLMGGAISQESLYTRHYLRYCSTRKRTPVKFATLKKWAKRYNDGERWT